MPATACSAGPRRRPRCAARRSSTARTRRNGRARSPDTDGFRFQRVDEQIAEIARRLAAIGAAQRPAQLPQRHRVDPADRPGQQFKGAVAVQPVGRGRQHRQHRPRRRLLGHRHTRRRGHHRYARRGQGAGQRRAALPHRADDHGHLRPRHLVDEVGSAQRVDDQRGFGVRRRGHPHGHRTRLLRRRRPVRGPVRRRAAAARRR